MIQKTDPRGVVSTYAYDALNRNTTINYSDTTSINPDVSRFYDGAAYGTGRLWYSYAGGNETLGDNVEKTVFESYDPLGRPTVLKQVFKLNNQWKTPYEMWRSYNPAGGVISQRYPSGRTVNYNYDSAGRLGDKDAQSLAFTGNLGGVQKTYSQQITYASAGQLQQEKFGTTTPVYNKRSYNSRLQLAEILTSTSGGDSSWNRGKIINGYSLQCSGAACNATDNNGNLRKQEVFVPHNDQMSPATSWYQQYDYDELNRLKRVHEYTGNPALDWQQEYLYDRWGNRRIDTNVANTYGTGINNRAFEKEDTTNRLYSPGDLALADTSRRIRYDEAGNQIKDTYTGYGTANFDAENRITAIQNNSSGWSNYTYNADGERTRRTTGNQTTWHIYGFDGELLAEYPVDGVATSPQKEYGYRNGELLIAAGGELTNFAFGKTATQSSTGWDGVASRAVDGNSSGVWANGSVTHTNNDLNAWWQVDLGQKQSLNVVKVWNRVEFPERLSNFYLFVSDTPFNSTDLTATQNQAGVSSYYTAGQGGFPTAIAVNRTGRYLRVQLAGTDFLSLAEVQAWGLTARANVALAGNDAVASASSANTCCGFSTTGAINGNNRGPWGNGDGWNDATSDSLPDWFQVDFAGSKTIDEIDVYSLHDNYTVQNTPTESQTFTLYGLLNFEVQYWNGSAWVTVPGGSVTGNNKVWRKFTFAPITTSKIRVWITSVPDSWSRIVEVEAYSSGAINWLVTDHLGTPRMIIDQTGSLTNVKRHDYLPFGEELFAQQGLRSVPLGYSSGDGVRQQFTSQERDIDTNLDYFVSRYHSAVQGRFTSADSFGGSQLNPQTLNLYSYVQNDPLNFSDPTGHFADPVSSNPTRCALFGGMGCNGEAMFQGQGEKAKPFGGWSPPCWPGCSLYPGQAPSINEKVEVNIPATPVATGDPVLATLPPSYMDYVPGLGHARQFLFNYTTHNFEGALGSFALMAVDLSPLGMIGRGAKLTSLGLQAAARGGASEVGAAGFDLALGLGKNAIRLAEDTGSLTYMQLAKSDVFSPENFVQFANRARAIRFTTEGMNWARWGHWARTPEALSTYYETVTNWELHQVLTNPLWLGKTIWY